jgi:hypothetical protein
MQTCVVVLLFIVPSNSKKLETVKSKKAGSEKTHKKNEERTKDFNTQKE